MKFIVFVCLSVLLGNEVNSQDLKKTLGKIKPVEISFHLSMPASQSDSSVWQTKFYLIVDHPVLKEIAESGSKEKLLPELVKLLGNEKTDWAAILLIYSITGENAIELDKFRPNDYKKWRVLDKQQEIIFWNKYIDSLASQKPHS